MRSLQEAKSLYEQQANRMKTEGKWKQYRRKGLAEMRPYVKGEDLTGISVGATDCPETDMGMIARNPGNHDDKWYVARYCFGDNFEEV